MPATTSASMPIDGLPWSWRNIDTAELDALVPLVVAADPSGTEALYWRRDSCCWLARDPARGITSIECAAGLALGLFFYKLAEIQDSATSLIVERLRWLELARPHRSLDAALTILTEQGRRLACRDVLLLKTSATEQVARQALSERALAAGFAPLPHGWTKPL